MKTLRPFFLPVLLLPLSTIAGTEVADGIVSTNVVSEEATWQEPLTNTQTNTPPKSDYASESVRIFPTMEFQRSRVDSEVVKIEGKMDKLENAFEKYREELRKTYDGHFKNLMREQDLFLNRLGTWLEVIGIIVALFGVCIPIVSTVLQWKNIRKGLRNIRKGKNKEMSKLREDIVGALHLCLSGSIVSFDFTLSSPSISNVPTSDVAMVLFSVVLCFDDLIEAAARTNNVDILEREIKAFRPFFERWSDSNPQSPKREEAWNRAKSLIEQGMRNKKREVSGKDFARLLGKSSEDLLWLKNLYKDFAAWRFE